MSTDGWNVLKRDGETQQLVATIVGPWELVEELLRGVMLLAQSDPGVYFAQMAAHELQMHLILRPEAETEVVTIVEREKVTS